MYFSLQVPHGFFPSHLVFRERHWSQEAQNPMFCVVENNLALVVSKKKNNNTGVVVLYHRVFMNLISLIKNFLDREERGSIS
jgi:hypothetical protein